MTTTTEYSSIISCGEIVISAAKFVIDTPVEPKMTV